MTKDPAREGDTSPSTIIPQLTASTAVEADSEALFGPTDSGRRVLSMSADIRPPVPGQTPSWEPPCPALGAATPGGFKVPGMPENNAVTPAPPSPQPLSTPDGRDTTIKSLRLYLDAKVEASPAVIAIFKWLAALIAAGLALS